MENPDKIIITAGKEYNIGKCLTARVYQVRSKNLSKEDVLSLRKDGILGFGQSFEVKEPVYERDYIRIDLVDIIDSSD